LERKPSRKELLAVAGKKLEKIREATVREKRRLKGQGRIGVAGGQNDGSVQDEKTYSHTINDSGLYYSRNTQSIETETALDGLHVIRTSVKLKHMSAEDVLGAYKGHSVVERVYRSLKTEDQADLPRDGRSCALPRFSLHAGPLGAVAHERGAEADSFR
jgi:hypothetical protein